MTTLTSPITGLAQTGLTGPTYTHQVDVAPDGNGRQVAVSALGGTQTNVRVSTAGDPFTINWVRPKVLRGPPSVNPVTNLIGVAPKNVWKLISRKGTIPLSGQAAQTMLVETTISIPAGSETADAVNVRAALSAHFGSLSQQSAAFGDSVVSGIL
jgi:hypothetical protein